MSLLRLYIRVLELLGKEARLGWMLAAVNLLLAAAQFAEPVLFGSIIDVLSDKPATGALASVSPWALLAAWAAFGLFTIGCGAVVALHADRLAHRQRQAVLTDYFEHIMQLPLTFHTGTHSGRLMKVMLNGTDALWRLWLGFFREHFAAIMSLFVLLPLSFTINWRLAILLFVLCVVFTVLTTLVARPMACDRGRGAIQATSRARLRRARQCRAVQSFVRIDAEVQGLRLSPTSSWPRRCRSCHVGAGDRDHPRLTTICAGDLHRRRRAARAGPDHRRRDRDVRLVCDYADQKSSRS
jgi:ATP-binding cassette subfamily B protein